MQTGSQSESPQMRVRESDSPWNRIGEVKPHENVGFALNAQENKIPSKQIGTYLWAHSKWGSQDPIWFLWWQWAKVHVPLVSPNWFVHPSLKCGEIVFKSHCQRLLSQSDWPTGSVLRWSKPGLFSKCGGQKLKKFHLMPSIFPMKMMTNSSPPNSVQVCVCVCACVCWWRAVLKKMEKAENNSGRSWENDLRT